MEASLFRLGVLDAILVSDPIGPLLEGRGRGTVHSIFERVLNVRIGGHLVTITGPSIEPLPNGVRLRRAVNLRRSALRPGLAVTVDGLEIAIPDAGLTIVHAGARRWAARLVQVDPSEAARVRERWRLRSRGVRALAAARIVRRPETRAGLGPLLWPDAGVPVTPFAALAAPRLARLAAALRADDDVSAGEAAVGLIGLGPGLTPSGDDALVGIAAARFVLPGPGGGGSGFLGPVIPDAAARTTVVAATFLEHAAAGEFAGGIHALLAALLGTSLEPVAPAIDRVLDWGATSGADTLVGVLAGLDAVAGIVTLPLMTQARARSAA